VVIRSLLYIHSCVCVCIYIYGGMHMSSTCSKTQYVHLNGPYMLEKPTNLKPRKAFVASFHRWIFT
jgi:hypothetical protein